VSSTTQHRSHRVFSVWAPVYENAAFQGSIVGVFRAEQLLYAVLADSASPQFKVAIFDDSQQPIYVLRADPGEQPTVSETATVAMHGIDWRVQVWPERPITSSGQPLGRALLAIGGLFAVTVGIILHLARRAHLAAATARESNEHLIAEISARRRAEESLHVLSGRLLKVQDEERQNLAHILHEGMAQKLFALSMNLKLVSRLAAAPEAQLPMQQSIDLADECVCEMRALTHLLHPPSLAVLGLLAACETFAQGFSERTGIQVSIEVSDDPVRFPRDMEMALFRIVQESLDNVHHHSGSKHARVRLAHDEGLVVLEVKDDGRGFGPDREGDTGIGIAGMRERMLQLGGELHIDSTSAGTTVRAILPYVPEREGAPSSNSNGAVAFADWESGRTGVSGRVN
jgi:signal transduction histidine kinase